VKGRVVRTLGDVAAWDGPRSCGLVIAVGVARTAWCGTGTARVLTTTEGRCEEEEEDFGKK
jgi:hypothetical protein